MASQGGYSEDDPKGWLRHPASDRLVTVWDLERVNKKLLDPNARITDFDFDIIGSFEGEERKRRAMEQRAQLLATHDSRTPNEIVRAKAIEARKQAQQIPPVIPRPASAHGAADIATLLESVTKLHEEAQFRSNDAYDRDALAKRCAAREPLRPGYDRAKFMLAWNTYNQSPKHLTDEDIEMLGIIDQDLADRARVRRTGAPPAWDDGDRALARMPVSMRTLVDWHRDRVEPTVRTLVYRSRESRRDLARIEERLDRFEAQATRAHILETGAAQKSAAQSATMQQALDRIAQLETHAKELEDILRYQPVSRVWVGRLEDRIKALENGGGGNSGTPDPFVDSDILRSLSERVDAIEVLPQANFRYRGVWDEHEQYDVGNFVTDRGSMWHCNKRSKGIRPGMDSGTFTLSVKHGRDGKDAR